jgi:hypothetical protein
MDCLLWRVFLFNMESFDVLVFGVLVVPSCGVPGFVLSSMLNTLLSLIVEYLLQLSCDGLHLGKIVPKSL